MNNLQWRWLIFFFALCSGVFDVFSTAGVFNLESNPIILLGGSFAALVFVKLCVIVIMGYQFITLDKYSLNIRYLLCVGMVLLIFLQLVAGANNFMVKKGLDGQAPPELSTAQKVNQVKSYVVFSLIFFYYPLLVAMSSFYIYRKVTGKKKKQWKVK